MEAGLGLMKRILATLVHLRLSTWCIDKNNTAFCELETGFIQ